MRSLLITTLCILSACSDKPETLYGHKQTVIANKEELILFTYYLRQDKPGYKEVYVHKNVSSPLKRMLESAQKKGIKLYVISGYRSYDYQRELFNRKRKRAKPAAIARHIAPPGYSEHHSGYAVDLAILDERGHHTLLTPKRDRAAYIWLLENASTFGFRLSFPVGNSAGVTFEPWHWRYEGKEVEPTLRQ